MRRERNEGERKRASERAVELASCFLFVPTGPGTSTLALSVLISTKPSSTSCVHTSFNKALLATHASPDCSADYLLSITYLVSTHWPLGSASLPTGSLDLPLRPFALQPFVLSFVRTCCSYSCWLKQKPRVRFPLTSCLQSSTPQRTSVD
jgi:hypothetical protein